MADREHDVEEGNEALDPELLYSKEYCIGQSRRDRVSSDTRSQGQIKRYTDIAQEEAVSVKFIKGTDNNAKTPMIDFLANTIPESTSGRARLLRSKLSI
jgi:hypothetical protein